MHVTRLAIAAFLALAAPCANAADPALEALLKAADIPFEIDDDGDYKVVYEWSKDKRSQLVYISGTPEELDGVKLYEIFSPAKVIDDATIDPALLFKALRMQPEQLGFQSDATIAALTDLVSYVAGLRQA